MKCQRWTFFRGIIYYCLTRSLSDNISVGYPFTLRRVRTIGVRWRSLHERRNVRHWQSRHIRLYVSVHWPVFRYVVAARTLSGGVDVSVRGTEGCGRRSSVVKRSVFSGGWPYLWITCDHFLGNVLGQLSFNNNNNNNNNNNKTTIY